MSCGISPAPGTLVQSKSFATGIPNHTRKLRHQDLRPALRRLSSGEPKAESEALLPNNESSNQNKEFVDRRRRFSISTFDAGLLLIQFRHFAKPALRRGTGGPCHKTWNRRTLTLERADVTTST
jgi:hypothetical protein